MFYYKITISYDGQAYKGWQRLNSAPDTIQEIIENALSAHLKEKVLITGSGRTDAGVHAVGQIANFATQTPVDTNTFLKMLNSTLPADIKLTSIESVSKSFHSRKSAIDKTYAYCISLNSKPDVFCAKYLYNPYQNNKNNNITFDFALASKAILHLIGTHDFSSFTTDKSQKSHIRTLYSIDLKIENSSCGKQFLIMKFNGNGFLYNMVRILAGTIWDVGIGNINPDKIPHILKAKKRALAGPTLPSNALFLANVNYEHYVQSIYH